MAGGPNAARVLCRACRAPAARTSEGLENDWYRCDRCGTTFGIDWSDSREHAFYAGKTPASVEWWLDGSRFPAAHWARIRMFDDGSADACWEAGGTRYGFADIDTARHFLAEDEYQRADMLAVEDDLGAGLGEASIRPPDWLDAIGQPFEYIGTY